MTNPPFSTIEEAIEDIRDGKMVIVCDAEDRENEGDLTMAAQFITPDAINFMMREGRGLICMPMTADRLDALEVPLQVPARNDVSADGDVGLAPPPHAAVPADRSTTAARLRFSLVISQLLRGRRSRERFKLEPSRSRVVATDIHGLCHDAATALASSNEFSGSVVPGTTGTPAAMAMRRAEIFPPIDSIASGGGPIKTSPASFTLRTNAEFSERKP